MNEKEIKAEIRRLIDRYKKTDPNTSEANIQGSLIDPLFALLGWDITNTKEYDRNSYVRGAGFADIGLLIEGKPVIFLEAKKLGKIPKNRIEPQVQTTLPFKELQHLIDRTPEEKQAMRYARGEGIPWAILTNFECLFVFNADHESIILSFKSPEEYLTRFDELWRLSKERIKEKSLEWLQKDLKKDPIDKTFLEKLENWRVRFAQNIYENNKDNHILIDEKGDFDFEKLMHIVQRILSRLLVISIADDKEVLETQSILENLYKGYENLGKYAKEDHLLSGFIALSNSMDKQHNTTIFAPGHPCEKVKISNEVFGSILRELCHISFRKMSVDILGATYESYLGYRFAIKNGNITAEVDPRVRKQSGIYYTPVYIVRYIVDNTLGKMLKEIEEEHDIRAIEEVEDLKVLDPACGSGSFLIYAFDVLADFYERQNEKITKKQLELSKGHANPTMFEQLDNFKNLPQREPNYPRKILEGHLYGVDLDPAAAEIATINLVIKAFEKMKGKKLPLILNQNIKVGNSLISGIRKKEDLEELKKEIAEHITLRKKLKETEEEKEKEKIMIQIDELRKKVNSELNESLKEYFENPEEKRPFNWEFEFPEVFDSKKIENEKGFDVVIGNPPYLLMQISNTPKAVLDYIHSYSKVAQYKIDSYHLFLERSISLLSDNGRHSFIIPNTFLTNKYTNRLREYILNFCAIEQIAVIPVAVFETAEVDNCIIVLQTFELREKRSNNKVSVLNFVIKPDKTISYEFSGDLQQRVFEENPDCVFNVNLVTKGALIASSILQNTIPLGSFMRVYFGIQTYDRNKFVSEKKIDKTYKLALDGEDINRFSLEPKVRFVKFVDSAIKSGGDKKVHFAKEKIIIPQIGAEPKATLDIERFCTLNTIYNLVPKDLDKYSLKYILGIINSELIRSFWHTMFYDRKQLFPKIKKKPLESIPIHRIDFSNTLEKTKHNQLVKYVNLMLDRNKQKNELGKIFAQVLGNHTHELRPLGRAYYDVAEYVERIDKKASDIANEKKEIPKISLKEKGNSLIFYVFFDEKWGEALRLTVKDENLRLFLFYSIRKYLDEYKRRKKWTTKSLTKVLDVILGRIEVPIFRNRANLYDAKHHLKMVNLLMKEFKSKFKKKFPKGNIHLSQIEEEIQDTDNSIDALVFKLYGLNKDEVITVLDSMKSESTVKNKILEKFKSSYESRDLK